MTTTAVSTLELWNKQAPLDTAKDALTRLHWSVIPIDDDKQPVKTGGAWDDGNLKRIKWKPFQTQLPTVGSLMNWQRRFNPVAWAIITGALSGAIVLDYDGPAGEALIQKYGLRPHVRTGSGGGHQYFKHPGWYVQTLNSKSKENLGKSWPGLDIRADGGYAVFCGRNPKGAYAWLREPELDDLSSIPEAIRRDLGLLWAPDSQEAQTHKQLQTREYIYSELLDKAAARVAGAHGRDNTAYWLASQLRDNNFSESEAMTVIADYVNGCPLYNTKGEMEVFTLDTAREKVRSAYSGMKREAWSILDSTDVTPAPDAQAMSNGHGGGKGTAPIAQVATDDKLPQITLSGQLRDKWNIALRRLREAEEKNRHIFVQSARLVQIGQDDKKHPIIMQLGVAELKNALSRSADYYRLKETKEEEVRVPISPPKEIAEAILALDPSEWEFPSLEAIVETPVMRPDGSILDTPGYDETTRLYYFPQEGMKACKVPSNPTRRDITAALATIEDAIGEFPYVDSADRANAYGCLLTPFIRPAVRHAPLALIDAPKQGTGKGLLGDTVSTVATGSSSAILTLSDSDEELQKSITALLIEGVTIITIDNISGKLQSKHLDGVLTADTWRGRMLGQSKMVKVPQRATWIATGNNIRLGGDLARRCYRIRLDPHVSRPWMRQGFKHEDLLTWVSEQRAELITALLTLARAWYVAGKPQPQNIPTLGTFTGWSKTVGGILEHCGIEGFLSNLDKLYDEADEDSAQWEGFLNAWLDLYTNKWKTTSEIVATITTAAAADSAIESADSVFLSALPDALHVSLKEKPASFSIILGKALEKRVEACFGDRNLRIEREKDSHTKGKKWRVVGDFADSADSSTSHVQQKNNHDNDAQKSDIENGEKHYPHYPQNGHIAQKPSDVESLEKPIDEHTTQETMENTLSANGTLSAALPFEGSECKKCHTTAKYQAYDKDLKCNVWMCKRCNGR